VGLEGHLPLPVAEKVGDCQASAPVPKQRGSKGNATQGTLQSDGAPSRFAALLVTQIRFSILAARALQNARIAVLDATSPCVALPWALRGKVPPGAL